MQQGTHARGRWPARFVHAAVVIAALLAMLPLAGTPVRAAGTATITVVSTGIDGVTPLPFVRFRVTAADGTVYGPLESKPVTGSVDFTVDLPDEPTTFTIDMETPPACGIAPEPQTVGPFVDGDAITVAFATDYFADCDLGALSAYVYQCPAGLDGASTDYATFRDGCLDAVNEIGVTFTEVRADLQEPQIWNTTTGKYGIDGRAPLVGLYPGTYRIERDPIENGDGLVIFCLEFTGTQITNPEPETTERMNLAGTGWGVEVDLAGGRIACDFFAVPGYTPDIVGPVDTPEPEPTVAPLPEPTVEPEPTAEPEPTPDDGGGEDDGQGGQTDNPLANDAFYEANLVTAGAITIHLASCPVGYEGGSWYEDCHGNGLPNQEVTAVLPSGGVVSNVTTLYEVPGPGIVSFPIFESGTWVISEDLPSDSTTYWVYCSTGDPSQPIPFTYDDSVNEAIAIDLWVGDTVVCDWFIVPDEPIVSDSNSITVVKRTCEVGYDTTDARLRDFARDCPTLSDGLPFVLESTSLAESLTGFSGDSGPGTLVFYDLPAGEYDLWEDVPGDFNDSYVFCSADGGSYRRVNYSDYRASFSLYGGKDVLCAWYNVPYDARGPSASIEIHKSLCPPGQMSDFYNACHDNVLPGTTFELKGPSKTVDSALTNKKGRVTFDELPGGTFTITEIPPDGVDTAIYVVHCTMGGKPFPITYDDSTGMRVRIKLPAYSSIICDWYNVPPAPLAPGSITVHKLLCEGNKDDTYNWSEECVNYGAGVEFALSPAGGAKTVYGVTNDDGIVVFGGLTDGAYTLDETTGDWCYAEADRIDAKGNVLVVDGGNTNVFIYNCGRPDVDVLPNTGVGSAIGGNRPAGMALWGMAGLAGLVALGGRRRRSAMLPVRIAAQESHRSAR